MSNGPKRITDLPVAAAYAATDLLVIVQNTATTPVTTSITPGLLLANYANTSSPTFTNNVTVANAINIGNTTVFSNLGFNTITGSVATFGGNQNTYVEIALYNANAQSAASADMIVFDNNGPLGNNWVDMGIVSSTWANAAWTISNPSDAYLYSANTNLSIGVQSIGAVTPTNYVNFFTGGSLAVNERMRIDASGNVNIGNTSTTGTQGLTIGNTQTNVVINSTSLKIGVIGTTNGAIVNTTTISVGNSSVNTFSNSSHFYSGNSTVYGVGNNTTEALIQTNFYGAGQYTQTYITAANCFIGNATIYGFGNSTVEILYTATAQTVVTAANVSVGGNTTAQTYINSTAILVGNSSVGNVVGITFSGNAASGPAYAQSLGYMGLPQNYTNTNYTLALSDFGGHILTQNT